MTHQNISQSQPLLCLRRRLTGPNWLVRAAAGSGLLLVLGVIGFISLLPPSAGAQTGDIPLEAGWSAAEFGNTRSVAWGDWDNDGDLDLAVGNFNQANRVYENVGGNLFNNPAGGLGWIAPQASNTTSVAWGDWDNDGDLDLAVGNDGQANQVYELDQGTLKLGNGFGWTAAQTRNTQSVAWGDWNNDTYLDLAVGNTNQPNQVYPNDVGQNFGSPIELELLAGFPDIQNTRSVAWGDWNNDSFLDLAVGNGDVCSGTICLSVEVYQNLGGTGFELAWVSDIQDDTRSVAWGDWDNDGDLDLAVGNGGIDEVYENEPNPLDNSMRTLLLDPSSNLGWESPPSTAADNTQSVSWSDVDNDGDLDLAVGNANIATGETSYVYCNDGTALAVTPCWSSLLHSTFSLAWGDADGDGDLDLAVGNGNVQPNRLYRNQSPRLSPSFSWESLENDNTQSIAWGDVDGDSDLDLAVGNSLLQPNRLYLNSNGVLNTTAAWESLERDNTFSVAWGDVDGDGDLDLAVGNSSQPNGLYLNTNGVLATASTWSPSPVSAARSVAWGDVDDDGDLDLAVGNFNDHNYLYFNEGGILATVPGWTSDEADLTTSVAWGDVDGDGDLDLAVGNFSQPNRLYLNHNGALSTTASWSSLLTDVTQSVAWGDVDGDGDLDLAVGNGNFQPNRVYTNDQGTLKFDPAHGFGWQSNESDDTNSIAWGDADGDGDLDLAVGNEGPNRLYRNDGGALTASAAWSSAQTKATASVAWGDVDGDGDLDLAGGNQVPDHDQLYLTHHPRLPLQPGQVPTLTLNLYSDPAPTFNQLATALAPANFYAVPGIRVGPTIPISYTLFDPEASSTWRVRGFFSPDGGGRWLPAVAASSTITQNIAGGVERVYGWDIANSGFFGLSDNVVFRLEALPGGPLPSPHPYVAAHTYPFRVRGTQVRVVNQAGQPVQGALVYHLPGGQPLGGADTPFRTSPLGYLTGQGEIKLGDQLVALWPISQTNKYTLYHTSATPTPTGLDAFTVSQSGVQTLTVSAANPLLLFNLNVSLEWDASNDPLFQTELEQNLERASVVLYDWTDGQAALGQVTIYQDKDHWDEVDVHIFASNQVRPIANRGGIVTATTVLFHPAFTEPLTATQGEIRIGPNWNRYGDPQPIGQDWPKVLAHELGHYALFLEDTYLGLAENSGLLIPIDTCTGTAMSDPYVDSSSEFRYDDGTWGADCGQTLAELPDWELIRLAYPALHSPPPANTGPTTMPLAFTQIEVTAAPGQPQPLLDDFNITLHDSLANGRAYLRNPGAGLVDLGRPVLNSILARGAREGDEICVFAATSFACSSLSNNSPAQLFPQSVWPAQIELTPTSSTTLQILVHNVDSGSLTATIYPNGEAPQVATLAPGVAQTVTLNQPAVEVVVDIAGDELDERMVTSYAIGAGPGRKKGHGGPGRKKGHGGPFASSDGSVVIYPPEDLPDDVFMVLQTATTLPELPPGLTAIGRAYHVRSSTAGTDFAGASLAFQYLGLDVLLAQKPEQSLAVYYWNGATWTRLETILNLTQNFASAPLPEAGLYVLTAGGVTPAISAVSPISGTNDLTHTLTISGQNFLSPLAITLRGQTSLSYSLTVVSVNTQTVTALTPITLPADLYDLELTNAGGLMATQPGAFALYTARPGACFFDDFASGWSKWTRSGEWDIITTGSHEAATDSPGASYLNAEPGLTRTTTITSQSFSLAACPNPGLSFRHDYVIAIGPGQHQDWGSVEISTNDGATWRTLERFSGGEGYSLAAAADEWSGVNWQTVNLNLAQAGVPTQTTTARLRFNLIADAVGSDKGWIIDEILVQPCPSQGCSPSSDTILYLPFIFKNAP